MNVAHQIHWALNGCLSLSPPRYQYILTQLLGFALNFPGRSNSFLLILYSLHLSNRLFPRGSIGHNLEGKALSTLSVFPKE